MKITIGEMQKEWGFAMGEGLCHLWALEKDRKYSLKSTKE